MKKDYDEGRAATHLKLGLLVLGRPLSSWGDIGGSWGLSRGLESTEPGISTPAHTRQQSVRHIQGSLVRDVELRSEAFALFSDSFVA